MTIKMVIATAKDHAIGLDNKLLWHIPEDLKNFKSLTDYNICVMGRKTHDSIKLMTKCKAGLPNRCNYVLSRKGKGLQDDNYVIIDNIDFLVEMGKHRDISIIGGSEVYSLCLGIVDEIYHTEIDQSFSEADTYYDTSFLKDTKVWEKVNTTRLTDIAQVVYYRRVD